MTARCRSETRHEAGRDVLQWRGGHVTARWTRMFGISSRRLLPSMEGRSRDRPMSIFGVWGALN